MSAHLISRLRGSVSPIATRRPRYFIYARFSHPKQAEGSSEERQVNMDWHRKEAERLGADLVEVPYIDRGKSGFYGDHLEGAFGERMPKGCAIATSSSNTSCSMRSATSI